MSPSQIGFIVANVGVTIGLTVIVSVALFAHWFAFGKKVYVVDVVLFKAGDQVPVMPLFEVIGKIAKFSPLQIGLTAVNVGVIFGFTIISIVCVVAH